jgi:hypothetical protein
MYLDNHTVEYWMPMTIDPIADASPDTYRIALQQQWKEKIRQMSQSVAQCFDNAPMKYTFKMRYQRNLLRVWFTLEDFAIAGLNEPLVEVPIVKDRGIAEEAEVMTYPPMADEIAANGVQTLFWKKVASTLSRSGSSGRPYFIGCSKKQQPNAGATVQSGQNACILAEANCL